MEMTFPPANRQTDGTLYKSDFRSLVSRVISQQSNSFTAKIVLASQRNSHPDVPRDDSMESRARYFAGSISMDESFNAPHGAFFAGTAGDKERYTKYDQAVYQDGLTIGKPEGIKMNSSDNLATKLGQEKPRSL
jgi:hypothetical protein